MIILPGELNGLHRAGVLCQLAECHGYYDYPQPHWSAKPSILRIDPKGVEVCSLLRLLEPPISPYGDVVVVHPLVC